MLKHISCPSTTTLVRCVVQADGKLAVLELFLEDFVALLSSSDSELELELELELEVELEFDSELDSDSDDDDEEDEDEEEDDDDDDDSDDDEEEDDESLLERRNSNPLALALLGKCLLMTSM